MDNFISQDQQLDNLLSEFTDQVLSSDEIEAKVLEVTNQDELDELKKTVLRMKAAVQMARTSDTTNARIRTRLLHEWKETRQAERQAPKRFVWNWSLSRLALAGGLAVLIILGVTTLLIPSTTPLIGTANGSQVWSPLFILVGIIIIAVLLWHDRHN
jgi:anti-sigma-K factor RskA